jgi:hypothetical protein
LAPDFILQLIRSLKENRCLQHANHCLLNDYDVGAGIAAHNDGLLYEPFVVVLSLGESCLLEFVDDNNIVVASLFVQANSIVTFGGKYYDEYKHRIVAKTIDLIDDKCLNVEQCGCGLKIGDVVERKSNRLSLTIRKLKSKPNWNLNGKDNVENENRDTIVYNDAAKDETIVSFLLNVCVFSVVCLIIKCHSYVEEKSCFCCNNF